MPVAVQTPVFEGPFDLLLHLILREEVDLYEVSLATIVDAYLAELDGMTHLDLEVATEFLLIATVLVELKTKRLLPDDTGLDPDEELGLWEQRDLLLARLVECKTFKDASRVLAQTLAVASRSRPRVAGPEERFWHLTPDLLAGVDTQALRAAYHRATRPRPVPVVELSHVTNVAASVTDTMATISRRLSASGTLSFRQLTSALVETIEIVVHFLAVLELYKQGLVDLDQADTFGDITISARVWTDYAEHPTLVPDLELVDSYEG